MHSRKNKVKIHRKLPDLGNLNLTKSSPLTSNLLLNISTIPLIQNNSTTTTHGIHRRSSVGRTPRALPPTPSMTQPTPIRPMRLNTHTLNNNKGELYMKTPRRLAKTPLNHPRKNAFTHSFDKSVEHKRYKLS